MMPFIDFIFRWLHVLAGITWIGMLYYFNFVQGEYFKEAEAAAKADATKKLAPRALWWFRWGAALTFLTGAYILYTLGAASNQYILLGALMGTFMAANVWFVIWPAQKIVTGMVEGDISKAAPKAGLASRTNTLFSLPMLWGMLGSKHGAYSAGGFGLAGDSMSDMGFLAALALIVVLEINALVGKMGPMASVRGVIHSSLALTVVIFALVHYL